MRYTQCTLELRPVKLLFVIFGRLGYCFLLDLKSNLSDVNFRRDGQIRRYDCCIKDQNQNNGGDEENTM